MVDNSKQTESVHLVEDGEGTTIKIREWRGIPVADFEGVGHRMDKLLTEFKPRPDDIFILAYTKCGTHWIHEIMHFLLTKQAVRRPATKEMSMIECVDLVDIDKKPSEVPRVLNCHVYPSLLPETVTKQCKIIYIIRNPKDVMVSLYNHAKNIVDYEYSGTIKGFQKVFVDGNIDGGSYFRHTREFMKILKEESPSNILYLEYEQLKFRPKIEIQRMHEFIFEGKEKLSEDLLDQIVKRVSFTSMQKDRQSDLGDVFKENTSFYRKGDVGDWKNWLSEEQNAEIDRLYEKEMGEVGDFYRPIYDLSNFK